MKDSKGLQERVLGELADIAFANAADFFVVEDGALRIVDSKELENHQLAAVAAMEKSASGIKVKLYDKLKALELLGKHLGLFEAGAAQVQPDNGLLEALCNAAGQEVQTNDISELQ